MTSKGIFTCPNTVPCELKKILALMNKYVISLLHYEDAKYKHLTFKRNIQNLYQYKWWNDLEFEFEMFDFLGCLSSFSSTFWLGIKVRDVRSSMLKFGELFEPVWALFRDIFGQIYLIKHEKSYCNISPHFLGLKNLDFSSRNEAKIKAKVYLNWQPKK